MRLTRRVRALAVLLLAPLCAAEAAAAGCREDHFAADQNLRKARAGIEKVARDTDAAKCTAHRRYIVALNGQRDVIARCDSGSNQAQNVRAIDEQIATFVQRARDLCKQ
jgi:predicted phage gp36 major capsid-like protein